MITDSYDESKPMIEPSDIYEGGYVADKCIVTFSHSVLSAVLKKYSCRKEAYSGTANGKIAIYSFMHKDEKILFYMSPIGSSISGSLMDEVHYLTGAEKFIVFGSCGSLDEKTKGRFIVPTESYRDEGFSYHYAKACDYMKIRNHKIVSSVFKKNNIPFAEGRSWTTDAIYRETVNNADKRKADGCICVEMESSGLQAICDYRNMELYTFFFTSDSLSDETWKNINLGTKEEKNQQLRCFDLALLIAKEI